MSITGGDVIIQILAQYNIEALFTSPIAALAPLWEAFAKRAVKEGDQAQPKYYNCRHETLAVSLAIGYYKATGKMAAVCLPTGLGVTNGSMALRMARQERIPMLVISPDTLTFGEDGTKDPGPEWATFLIDDHGPAKHAALTTKWSIACRTNLDLIPNLHRGIYFARQVPCGPTMVEIPFDIMMSSFDDVPNRFPVALASDATQASESHLSQVASLISTAKSPIIITEHFGRTAEASNTLTQFAETIGAPVFEWWMPCYENIPRSHPLKAIEPVEGVLPEADLVIVAASHGPWHSPASSSSLPTNARVIVLEADPLRPASAYWGYATTDCVSGDPVANLSRILSLLQGKLDTEAVAKRVSVWGARNAEHKRKFEEGCKEDVKALGDGSGRVHASVFFDSLAKVLPNGSIVVDEMVAQVPHFTHFLFRDPSKRFVHARGWQGGLGTGLGVALGAKVGNPDKVVVCVCGDGAFSYNPIPAAFGFAQQYRTPILVCIMNNEGYISQTWNFYRYFPEGAALSSKNTLGNVINPVPKYSLLAGVWGGRGEEVSGKEGLDKALQEAVSADTQGGVMQGSGIVLLDVKVTP